MTKRKQLDDKRLLEAYHSSNRTIDEIMEFLNVNKDEETVDG